MARESTDFTFPLVIALVADAALVIALAAGTNVGSPPAVVLRFPEGPPREVRECGDGSVERLIDKVRDEQNVYQVGREIAAHIDACGRWWFDPAWAYSLCAAPRFDQLVGQLLELHDSGPGHYPDPQLARLRSWRYGDSSEVHVLSDLLTHCERWDHGPHHH